MKKEKKTFNPVTIQEAYEQRPRLWWVYTIVILIVASLLTWWENPPRKTP